MNKSSVLVILNNCFETEGNCCYLHLVDMNQLLVIQKPKCFDLHMQVEIEYDINGSRISEVVHIPYSSIVYITVTNTMNLQIISEQKKSDRGITLEEIQSEYLK